MCVFSCVVLTLIVDLMSVISCLFVCRLFAGVLTFCYMSCIVQLSNVFVELEYLLYSMLVMFHVTLKTLCNYSLTVGTFETVEEADRAKEALNGADIYSGCCTLKVEWGKVCTAQYRY